MTRKAITTAQANKTVVPFLEMLSELLVQSVALRSRSEGFAQPNTEDEPRPLKVVTSKPDAVKMVSVGGKALSTARALAGDSGAGSLFASATHIVDAAIEYAKVSQLERTKRAHIGAWRDARIKEIEAERELLATYVAQVFTERQEVLSRLLDDLEAANSANQPDQMQVLLQGILVTVQTNPVRDLAMLRQQLEAGSVELEL